MNLLQNTSSSARCEDPRLLSEIKSLMYEPIQNRRKHCAFIHAHERLGHLTKEASDSLIRAMALHDAEELHEWDPVLAVISGRQWDLADSFGMWDQARLRYRGKDSERLPGMKELWSQYDARIEELALVALSAWGET